MAKANSIINLAAKALSVLSCSIIMLFIIGEFDWDFQIGAAHLLRLMFFPAGILLGLAIGWFKPSIGGVVCLLSLSAFYLLDYVDYGRFPKGWAFIAFSSPGFLFLIDGLISAFKKILYPDAKSL